MDAPGNSTGVTDLSQRSVNTENRLGPCEVCAKQAARYTCPKCEVKTCCLACVQIHKKELTCNGIRDRTKYIPIRQMKKMDFMSDYYFLEECTRYVEDRKKDPIKNITWFNKMLPIRLYRLRNAAAERKILLQFLLPNTTRHKINSTYYDWSKHVIFWRVEWLFVNANCLKYADERCSEDATLATLLDKYINADNSESVPQKRSLEYYQSTDPFRLKVYLKAEGTKRNGSRYYLLNLKKTLKQNLSNKIIIEYPTIYVSYDENMNGFDVIDSDEDISDELELYKELASRQFIQLKRASDQKDVPNNHAAVNIENDPKIGDNECSTEKKRWKQRTDVQPSNFLFSNDKLLDELSSSSASDEEINSNFGTNE